MKKSLKFVPVLIHKSNELKQSIKENTLLGFLITLCFLVLLSSSVILLPEAKAIDDNTLKPTDVEISIFISPPKIDEQIKREGDDNISENHLVVGSKEIAGEVHAVQDELIKDDLIEFADITNINIAFSRPGDDVVPDISKNVSLNIPFSEEKIIEKIVSDEEEQFVAADVYPSYDKNLLLSKIKYPETARRNGLTGKVVLQLMIDTDGHISNIKVVHSDNRLFNNSAIDAIKDIRFQPAIQNGKRIKCPVIVPIIYQLN